MTETEELEWLRGWRTRIISAHRLWWKPSSYADACKKWTVVKNTLAEKPPGHNTDGKRDE